MMTCCNAKINITSSKETHGQPGTSGTSGIFWNLLGRRSRASQLSHTNRGSRPEILEISPGKTEEEEVKQSCFFDRRVKPRNLERLNKVKEECNGDERS